ncbi:hypothetical protein ABAC402_04025 [Asticcacaulis sp. AC402]|nr:hypothetical protein ABAC402_04025 [Asticcacaulis sp. AC402]
MPLRGGFGTTQKSVFSVAKYYKRSRIRGPIKANHV